MCAEAPKSAYFKLNTMSNTTPKKKKSAFGFFVFFFFIGFLPIATFFFSYFGLGVHKNIKSEMRFFQDSIRINFAGLNTYVGDTLNNADLVEQIAVVAFWEQGCDIQKTVQLLKDQRAAFGAEDQGKMQTIIHRIDNPTPDSTWNATDFMLQNRLDTFGWKILEGVHGEAYPFLKEKKCDIIALLDGRVSRKDKTGGYVNGPILADYYDMTDAIQRAKLLRNITIVLPKKARKSIEFKADEKLF